MAFIQNSALDVTNVEIGFEKNNRFNFEIEYKNYLKKRYLIFYKTDNNKCRNMDNIFENYINYIELILI
jgi:hypothetical protein